MTAQDLARAAGLNKATVARACRNGVIKATRRGPHWHVTPAEARRYLASRGVAA